MNPVDQGARDRIATDLGTTLFVEAGAGSGKTTALVNRVVGLVDSGVSMEAIATITFTEKAAIELRHRIRTALQLEPTPRRNEALGSLDRAALGTLHGFARRLLAQHAIAAGLPPHVEVLDEIASVLAFEERWQINVDELLTKAESDPSLASALILLRDAGIKALHLRQLAVRLGADWDRVEDWIPAPLAPLAPLASLRVDDLASELDQLVQAADQTAGLAPDDRLVNALQDMRDVPARLLAADLTEQCRLIASLKPLKNAGTAKAWINPSKDATAQRWTALRDTAFSRRSDAVDLALRHIAVTLGQAAVAAARDRRHEGRLEFHDLLVLARRMLTSPASGEDIRTDLHRRYQRLLVDEFQDTDPIQLELAQLITAPPSEPKSPPVPGRLFVVGDPKQSIYRFRRADIATYLSAKTTLGAEVVQLTENFRSTQPIMQWVNHVFAQLIVEKIDAQAPYTPLSTSMPGATNGPHVVRFGAEAPSAVLANDIRVAEANDVVRVIANAMRWHVRRDGRWQPSRYCDIAILLPTRISLPALEDALSSAGIAYRAESSSLVYATREIRDLLLTLQAIDDPSDELAFVSALRSPLFGCSDVDLLRWRSARNGRWNLSARTLPDPLDDDPVRDACIQLRELHDARHWLTPAALLDSLIGTCRSFEVAVLGGRYRDVWRRLRFVVDQARAWSDAGGVTLRDYLRWCTLQGLDGANVAEAVLPETDDDAVRILTIHAAKGLEFPIVIVSGLSTARSGGGKGVQVRWRGSTPQISLRNGVSTTDYEAARELDDQMDHEERLRLLYVACTRASDHLAISVHRKARSGTASVERWSSADLIASASERAPHQQDGISDDLLPDPSSSLAHLADTTVWLDEADFQSARRAQYERAARTTSVSPSGLAALSHDDEATPLAWPPPGLVKDARSLELPAWNRGRYGTAIGRAVHAVLQRADLVTGNGIESLARAQAAAEGILGTEETISRLARVALESPTVRVAAHSEHWREMYVGTTISGRVLEGYVDLMYRTPDGLVVVDYKTDAVTLDDVDARVERYRLQGAGYALGVEAAVGETVVAVDFVFCRPDGVIERRLPQLAEACADALSLIDRTGLDDPPTIPIA